MIGVTLAPHYNEKTKKCEPVEDISAKAHKLSDSAGKASDKAHKLDKKDAPKESVADAHHKALLKHHETSMAHNHAKNVLEAEADKLDRYRGGVGAEDLRQRAQEHGKKSQSHAFKGDPHTKRLKELDTD